MIGKFYIGVTTYDSPDDWGYTDVARQVATPYVGVNGVSRKITKGYIGVNGVARTTFQSLRFKLKERISAEDVAKFVREFGWEFESKYPESGELTYMTDASVDAEVKIVLNDGTVISSGGISITVTDWVEIYDSYTGDLRRDLEIYFAGWNGYVSPITYSCADYTSFDTVKRSTDPKAVAEIVLEGVLYADEAAFEFFNQFADLVDE